MLSKEQIERAKAEVEYDEPHHEHDDCVRIAYEWMDAQKKTKNIQRKVNVSKALIEKWAGRYVSTSDVVVAAHMHPEIKGTYPCYNLSSRLTEPSTDRLRDIGEAFTQSQRSGHDPRNYDIHE